MTGLRGNPGYSSICPICGKRSFTTKRLAKRMAKKLDRTLRVYQCGNVWHTGHLPQIVLRGEIDRRTLYQGPTEEGEDAGV